MKQQLDLVKQRSARRQAADGAAMFVVSMTLAVLASVGLFALAAASTEVKTSGNERQATQTHNLADYAMISAAHEVTGSKAQGFLGLMMTTGSSSYSATVDKCMSLPLPASVAANDALTRACRRIESKEIQTLGNWAMAPTVMYGGGTTPNSTPNAVGVLPGSLGTTSTDGAFFVELTNPQQMTAPARYALNLNLCFVQFTATSGGVTHPWFGGNIDYGHQDTELQRGRLVAGPIQCPK